MVNRDFFEEELRFRLGESWPDSEVNEAVSRLRDWGLLDNSSVGLVLRERLQRKRYGPEKVRWEMLRRGVPEELADWVLAQPTELDDLEQAREAAAKKFPKGEPPGRVARYLMSRGFPEEVVREIVESDYPALEPES